MQNIIFIFLLFNLLSCNEKTQLSISMEEDVIFLASDDLEGRKTGTRGELKTANYIKKRFESLGLTAKGDSSSYFQRFTFKNNNSEGVRFRESENDSLIEGINVIGYWGNNAKYTVVIGAHYNHLDMGEERSLYKGEKTIHNGTDDNASGIAILLQLAKKLQDEKFKENNYLFIAFSGGEMELLESNFFC